ncbi:MAG: TonB-dependent receptor, partial [Candidatus Latescibacterota bacterium]
RQRDNIGRLLTAGIETELAFRPYPLWSFSVSHVYDHTEILESDDPELVGKRQRQTPLNQFVVRAACDDHSLLAFALQGRYVSRLFDDDVNKLPSGDFFVMDLHLSREFMREGEVFVGVENLLDRVYEVRRSTTGYVEVGRPRYVHGGIRVRI